MTSSKIDLNKILRSAKLKATKPRLDVLSIINKAEAAVSHSEIQAKLESFDRVTLYRTLNTLIEKGIIHKAHVESTEVFYAMCTTSCTEEGHKHEHIHFVCDKCEEVTCIDSEPISIKLPNHIISEVRVQATGICDKCFV